MATNRRNVLREMLAQNPNNTFARYGLAMDYANSGDLDAAVAEFQSLIQETPDYAAAYFHGGQTLERQGKVEEAADWYRKGIVVTNRIGDLHTRGELQAALDLLPL